MNTFPEHGKTKFLSSLHIAALHYTNGESFI